MPLFRREKLHERLARTGGLEQELGPEPVDTHPRWGATGIHGVPRPRRWDAVVAAQAPGLEGDEARFVALADGSLVIEEDAPEGSLEPLADALDDLISPPYRAEAVRREGDVWAVAARRIELVELSGTEGDELSLTIGEAGRRFLVDGNHGFGSVPELERIAGARYGSYVAEATRIDGDLFEFRLTPL